MQSMAESRGLKRCPAAPVAPAPLPVEVINLGLSGLEEGVEVAKLGI